MLKAKNDIEDVKHNLELDEEIKLHKKGWVIQRIGWGIMLLIMLAGAIGSFGEGFLSKQTPSHGNMRVAYERYFRYEAEMKIVVESGNEHICKILLPHAYLKNFRIVRFVPEPLNNLSIAEDVVFNFGEGHNRIVSIYLVPKDYGAIKGDMKINGTDTIPLHHFIYP